MLGLGYGIEKRGYTEYTAVKQNIYKTYISEGTECGVGSSLIKKDLFQGLFK